MSEKDKQWFDLPPWPERLEAGWEKMSSEHKQEFMAQSWENHLRKEYEMSLEMTGYDGPPWDELTEKQRKRIETQVKQNAQEMRELVHYRSYPPKDPAVECVKGDLAKAKDQDMKDNHNDTTEDHAAAYAAGQKEGMSMGYVEGYNSGLADGQKEGLTMGLIEGYNDAKKAE